MNDLGPWLPWIWSAYKWTGLGVGVAVYLANAAPFGERLLNAVVSAVGWPVVVYRYLAAKD